VQRGCVPLPPPIATGEEEEEEEEGRGWSQAVLPGSPGQALLSDLERLCGSLRWGEEGAQHP